MAWTVAELGRSPHFEASLVHLASDIYCVPQIRSCGTMDSNTSDAENAGGTVAGSLFQVGVTQGPDLFLIDCRVSRKVPWRGTPRILHHPGIYRREDSKYI